MMGKRLVVANSGTVVPPGPSGGHTVIVRTSMSQLEVRELLESHFPGGVVLLDVVVDEDAYMSSRFGIVWSVIENHERF